MNPQTLHAPDTDRWDATFPWLDLNSDERHVLDHAGEPDLDRIAMSLAHRAIDQELMSPLDRLLPTLPPAFELESLDWPARQRNVLRRHQLTTAADLGSITIADLLATWSVSTFTTKAILTQLFRTAMNHHRDRS